MPRWETEHIPKAKVAKVDKSVLNKEQTVYMPRIPDVPACPEHLMPSKEWEDVFLADFSKLRLFLFELFDESLQIFDSVKRCRTRFDFQSGWYFGGFDFLVLLDYYNFHNNFKLCFLACKGPKVVDWPPIRSFQNNMIATSSKNNDEVDGKPGPGTFSVKVSMDGAPYLRKVYMGGYSTYRELSSAP